MDVKCPHCGGRSGNSNGLPMQSPMIGNNGRNSNKGGNKGCFITTACCEYKGLEDDCEMLNTFRHFRDTYMSDNYPDEIELYYSISPGIIDSVLKRKDSGEVLERTYRELLEAKILIDSNQLDEAYLKYRQIVLNLQERCIASEND